MKNLWIVLCACVACGLLLGAASAAPADNKADKKANKKGDVVRGRLVTVDAENAKIVIRVKENKEEKEYKVGADAKIVLNGEAKALADLTPTGRVAARLSADGQQVTHLRSGKKKPANE